MEQLSREERNHYLLTKRVAGFLILEETGAVQQAVSQIRAIVADAINPLARAVESMQADVDAETRSHAVRALQFADMVDQLAAYCDAELGNVVQLSRELNDHVNHIMEDKPGAHQGLVEFQQVLEARLEALRKRLADHGHKSVVQQNVDEGDIELF